MEVPCGQCIGCRVKRTQAWAARVMHEASLHARNSFLTLTYEKDPISLDVDDLQRFFKRVRKSGLSVRHYSCGEYGSKLGRPHFHVCLFGHDFLDDGVPWSKGLWISPRLAELWGHGHCVVGNLEASSAAYVASYCQKKITGEAASEHYFRVSEETGEVFEVRPEFSVMSRGGRKGKGIAYGWWEKYGQAEVARDDSVIVDGREASVPRYYDQQLKAVDERVHAAIKEQRRSAARKRAADNTELRLGVSETVARAKLGLKRRSYET